MKNKTGIWIDSSRAILVALKDGKEHISEIESEIENSVYHEHEGNKGTFMGQAHINNEKTFDERRKNQMNAYLKKVVDHIKEVDAVYVFGPAETKIKLKQRIESHHQLSDRLKDVETADSMTLNQVIAKTKDYFKV